jgi:phage host-nuclease inhibitor protein Gam
MPTTPRNKTRLKAVAAPTVPQTRDQVAELIARIGTDSRTLKVLEVEMNEALAAIKEQYEQRAEPTRQSVDGALRGVQAWCEANRLELTVAGKVKTHAFTTGEVAWRTRPAERAHHRRGSGNVLAAQPWADALSAREDRDQPRGDPQRAKEVAGVPGIKISQIEDFVVTPFEVELAQ